MKAILKYAIVLFLSCIFCSKLSAQAKLDSDSTLVGKWKFVARYDKNGKKVDTIYHSSGIELANGPLMTYRIDGTYSFEFTSVNIDNGKWVYDKNKQVILHQFYYSKPYSFAAKYLIDKGHAKKDVNGDYYEDITKKVIELTNNKLVILERYEQQSIYQKIK